MMYGLLRNLFLVLLLSGLGPQVCLAQNRGSITKNGPFSLMAFGGLESLATTNQDGLNAVSKNNSFGIRAQLRPAPEALPGFQIFVDGALAEGTNTTDDQEEISTSSVRFGFTQNLSTLLYVGGFYGNKSISGTNQMAGTDTEVKARTMGLGIGMDLLNVRQVWAISIEVWQQYGHAPKSDTLGFNTGISSTEYFLGVKWSPSVTINW